MKNVIRPKYIPSGQRGTIKPTQPDDPLDGRLIDQQWFNLKWFVAKARSRPAGSVRRYFDRDDERQITEADSAYIALNTLGVPTFIVEEWVKVRGSKGNNGNNGRRRYKRVPVFPGFVFIAIKDEPALEHVHNCRHIDKLLGYGIEPHQVPLSAMLMLFTYHNQHVGKPKTNQENFKPGDIIEVLDGPWQFFEAIVNRQKSDERIEILLEMFGTHRPVEISLDSIQKI